MAKGFIFRSVKRKQYLFFLVLVFIGSMASIVVYIISEGKQLEQMSGDKEENASFLLKLKQAASVKSKLFVKHGKGLNGNIMSDINGTKETILNILGGSEGKKHNDTSGSNQRAGLVNVSSSPNYNIHLFYYAWYGNADIEGYYLHWNHPYLPHWRKEEARKWMTGVHKPPDDIGANFYPQLGPYSSGDPKVVDKHMLQIRSTGAGVIVVSWYPPDESDENGKPVNELIPLILDTASQHDIKVAFHLEPFKNRNGETLNKHIRYIIDNYGDHPGFYRRESGHRSLPVYYVYDSYQVDSKLWADALKPIGKHSLRGGKYDGIFLGLYIGPEDEVKIIDSGFDGFYTYFAAKGFTKGSSWNNWKSMASFAAHNNLLFVPSVGPGYVDTQVRPWNSENTRQRLKGLYFQQAFQAAVDTGVEVISVTSFNEWHEGTQIEPSVPKTINGFRYEDYAPMSPDFYLQLLRRYVDNFSKVQKLGLFTKVT